MCVVQRTNLDTTFDNFINYHIMTLQQFVDKYNGKGIDFDGHYGFQCVDLYRQYVQEVLQNPQSPGVSGAKDIWNSYLTEYYDRISNTPEGVPVEGDIMIWGDTYGQYGHVAVVTKADTKTFTCFSQNDPLGALCGLKTYTNWKPVLGWLHPKPKDTMYRGYDLNNPDSMKIAVDKLCDILEGKYITSEEHQRIINELDSKSTEQAQSYAKEKQVLEDKIKTLDSALLSLQTTEHTWQDTADSLQRKFKVVIDYLADEDVSVTVDSTEEDIKSALSSVSHAEEIADLYAAIQSRLILKESSPEGFLEALGALEIGYNKKIESLKKKQPTLWQFIINKYFK